MKISMKTLLITIAGCSAFLLLGSLARAEELPQPPTPDLGSPFMVVKNGSEVAWTLQAGTRRVFPLSSGETFHLLQTYGLSNIHDLGKGVMPRAFLGAKFDNNNYYRGEAIFTLTSSGEKITIPLNSSSLNRGFSNPKIKYIEIRVGFTELKNYYPSPSGSMRGWLFEIK